MEQAGYQVKWTDTRENITFTTPTGMKCRDKRLGEPEYYNKHNFELIFEQNSQFVKNNKTEEREISANAAIQGISDLTNLFSDDEFITITDGFMLQDVDFEEMSWLEIEQTIERLRREAETRKSRAMANQDEHERKAAEQAFWQRMALLDEFEDWMYERRFGRDENDYEPDYDEEGEDEWER